MYCTCNIHGGDKKCTQNSSWITEVKGPLGRLNHRWESHNKMDVKEIGWESAD